jgi:hypothetical protein
MLMKTNVCRHKPTILIMGSEGGALLWVEILDLISGYEVCDTSGYLIKVPVGVFLIYDIYYIYV